MTTDLLTLTRWLSPAFPTGAFSWSHGLEAHVSAGDITDAAGVATWLADIVELGAGRTDAVILAAVLAGRDPAEMTDLARALAPSAERLAETVATGAAFARTLRAQGITLDDAPMPVVVGAAARRLDLPPETVIAQYLQAFATNLVQIAIRMGLIGQTEAQSLLAELAPLFARLATAAAGTRPEDIASFTPGSDLMSIAHETQETRLWRS